MTRPSSKAETALRKIEMAINAAARSGLLSVEMTDARDALEELVAEEAAQAERDETGAASPGEAIVAANYAMTAAFEALGEQARALGYSVHSSHLGLYVGRPGEDPCMHSLLSVSMGGNSIRDWRGGSLPPGDCPSVLRDLAGLLRSYDAEERENRLRRAARLEEKAAALVAGLPRLEGGAS